MSDWPSISWTTGMTRLERDRNDEAKVLIARARQALEDRRQLTAEWGRLTPERKTVTYLAVASTRASRLSEFLSYLVIATQDFLRDFGDSIDPRDRDQLVGFSQYLEGDLTPRRQPLTCSRKTMKSRSHPRPWRLTPEHANEPRPPAQLRASEPGLDCWEDRRPRLLWKQRIPIAA
jgi:hypothetical protein